MPCVRSSRATCWARHSSTSDREAGCRHSPRAMWARACTHSTTIPAQSPARRSCAGATFHKMRRGASTRALCSMSATWRASGNSMSSTPGACCTIPERCGSPSRTPAVWCARAVCSLSVSTITAAADAARRCGPRPKRWYCSAPRWQQLAWEFIYLAWDLVRLAAVGRNPIRMIRDYHARRGMSWRHDAIDWLGGYPYEAATPGEILEFVRRKFGFVLVKQNIDLKLGVSEFVFQSTSHDTQP